MRKSICLIVFSLLFLGLHAQNRDLIVIDPAHVAAIAAASELDKEAYEDIRENEDQTNQLLIVTNLVNEQIKAIEDTTLNYMKRVQSVLRQVYTLETIVQKTVRIGDNIVEMAELAYGDPELSFVALQMSNIFSDELRSLTSYISDIALGEGSSNLLNNYERLKIINHVDTKLNKLEGVSLQMLYRMKYAKRHGVLQTLFPVLFAYERRNQQLAEQIVNNFHF